MLQLFVLGGGSLSKRDFPMRKRCAQTRLMRRNGRRSLALLEYRQGHFSTKPWVGVIAAGHAMDDANARTAATSLIKAMAGWRLGWLPGRRLRIGLQAYELIHAKSQQGLNIGSAPSTLFPGTPEDLEGSWYDWVIADLLMRECDELFAQSERTLDSMSKSDSASTETVMDLARALGEWHAIRGEWEQARNRFSQLPEDGGARVQVYFLTAIIAAKAG